MLVIIYGDKVSGNYCQNQFFITRAIDFFFLFIYIYCGNLQSTRKHTYQEKKKTLKDKQKTLK